MKIMNFEQMQRVNGSACNGGDIALGFASLVVCAATLGSGPIGWGWAAGFGVTMISNVSNLVDCMFIQ